MKQFKFAAVAAVACLLTSVSVLGASDNKEVTCHVRVTGTQEWTPRVELSVNDKAADVIYGTGTEGVTALDALVEACYYATYSKDPTIEDLEKSKKVIKVLMGTTSMENTWVEGIMGDVSEGNKCWLFVDGKTSPAVGILDYEVTEKSDLWFYYSDWMLGYRGYFDKTEYNAKAGETVDVALVGVSVYNEMCGEYKETPLAGTITVAGNDKTYKFTCDAEGKAKLENLPSGEYTLSATWEDVEEGFVLIPATATVKIQEETTTVDETTTVAETTKVSPSKASIKSVKNVKGKKAKIKINSVNGVTGYQIKYSTSKKFKAAKVVRTKKTTYTVRKLKKGKKYYVKVRAYITVNKERYYGSWSKVKKIKIKK